MKEKKRILNNDIRSKTVKLIDDSGESLGVMPITEAKAKAELLGLDLMEMSNDGVQSIVKILDYGKFLYKLKKQENKNKVKGKAPDLKTIRISFKIGDHDLEIRKKQAIKFSNDGHPIKITMMLKGRENHYSELAMEKMKNFVEGLKEYYKLEGEIKKNGNIFVVMMKPNK